jgi:hypothetical protein
VKNSGEEPQHMKKDTTAMKSNLLLALAVGGILSLTASANAQYRPIGEDGIVASPKLRQQLNERKSVASVPSGTVASVGYRATGENGVTASPKLRQQLNESRAATSTPHSEIASVGYKPTGNDGITASPKLRQQLNERRHKVVQIAPLK